MSPRHTPHAGLVEVGGLRLPFLAEGEPRRLDGSTVVFPAGQVSLLHPFGDTDFYRHGWNSWGPSGWRRLSGPPLRIEGSPERLLTADDARNDTPAAHSGSAVGALASPDRQTTLLLGALGLGAPRVGATTTCLWGTQEVPAGEWLLAVGEESAVFGTYAAAVAERLGHGRNRAGRVWSSWYSQYEDIDEPGLRGLVADLRGYPFDVIQVDDGWERLVGDWQANAKFPSGMAGLGRTITDAGFRAGLWLAPFIALPGAGVVRDHPDWWVRDDDGSPLVAGYNWGSPYYCLDTTRPAVRDHLARVFTEAMGWGFTYFKLDFVYAAALAGVRSADVHREQAYRDAVAWIRQVVGDDVYLLGSGVPMLPSAGIFDGVRTGPDVMAFWDNAERPHDPSGVGAKNAMRASLHRRWLRPLYETDPDAVYFRRRRSLLDDTQRQAVQDVATILGSKATSDPIAWLDPSEREELRAWLTADETITQTGRYAYVLDGRPVDLSWVADDAYAPSPSTNAG